MRKGYCCFLPLLCSLGPMGPGCRKCLMLMFCLPVSWAVHGMRGGATINAGAGLQHQNSGHQVRLHTAHRLQVWPFSRFISALFLRGRDVKSVVTLWKMLWLTHTSLTSHLLLCPLARFPSCFRSILLAGLVSFCFSIWLHLPVCVCMYTPAALRAPKLECSGILVVSIWFPQWCLSPWQRRAQSPGTINSITRCQISFNIHKCESGKVFRLITCHLQTCMFFIFQGSYLCGVWGSTRCQRSPQEKGRRYIQEHTPIQSIIYL